MSGGNDRDTNIVDEFRDNGGKVGGPFEGAPLLILHTTGAKSGEERVHPLMYQAVDGKYAIFASKGGAPTNPAWFHNLLANPETTIEIGTETKGSLLTRSPAPNESRSGRRKRSVPWLRRLRTKTSRTIPVVILDPVE